MAIDETPVQPVYSNEPTSGSVVKTVVIVLAFVALAVGVRSSEDFDRACWINTHFRGFPQADTGAERADRLARRNAAGLDVGGEAEPAQLAVTLEVGEFQRLCKRGVVVAGA